MNQDTDKPELCSEYDFSSGVRGRHIAAYREGTNLVLLDPDVAAVFHDSSSVNRALRLLMDIAKKEASPGN